MASLALGVGVLELPRTLAVSKLAGSAALMLRPASDKTFWPTALAESPLPFSPAKASLSLPSALAKSKLLPMVSGVVPKLPASAALKLPVSLATSKLLPVARGASSPAKAVAPWLPVLSAKA